MTDRLSEPDQDAVPEDIATLYSLAHVEGKKYSDFSASRNQVRGQFRRGIEREPAGWSAATRPAEPPPRQTWEQVEVPQLQAPQLESPPLDPRAPDVLVSAPESRPQEETIPQPNPSVGARWYALHSVFTPAQIAAAPPLIAPIPLEQLPPALVVFSVAGGVGKTCLVATLGRALSGFGEHVLLADTAACGLLPFYFGSREQRTGMVRTFSPPLGAEGDTPVQICNLLAARTPWDGQDADPLLGELVRNGSGLSRILVDVTTGSRAVTNRLLLLQPTVLVPVLPDMSSVASLRLLETLLADPARPPGQALYLLNQFDDSSPLHLDVRATLQQQLGDRLLPFVLRRSVAVSEALAEGMTVIDYAPDSPVAEDYRNLADWLRRFSAPAAVEYSGARWSER